MIDNDAGVESFNDGSGAAAGALKGDGLLLRTVHLPVGRSNTNEDILRHTRLCHNPRAQQRNRAFVFMPTSSNPCCKKNNRERIWALGGGNKTNMTY